MKKKRYFLYLPITIIWILCFSTSSCRGQDSIESSDEEIDTTIDTNNVVNKTVKVTKCCELDQLVVESHPGHRACRKRTDLLHIDLKFGRTRWEPSFHDSNTGQVTLGPRTYVLEFGPPACSAGDVMFAVSHSPKTDDKLMLLENGTMSHQLVHNENMASKRVLYPPGRYCVDDLIITHNFTLGDEGSGEDDFSASNAQDEVLEFAYICVDQSIDVQSVVKAYVYPVGLAVSMMSLVLTFLLYTFLPQLRDLTGKFILGICALSSIAFALMLVDIFGWKDPNVEQLVTGMCHIRKFGNCY